MQVSIFAAFLAGLISFLSPCVLPLVPGYISMLSGIGVEQLRQGERPRSSLFASSLAFVIGFSVVFITFGASASAVGQFLVRNRSLLAPFAGAVIVLFGLHLIGWLGRIPVRGGLLIGGALLALAAVVWIWLGGDEIWGFGPAQLISVSLIFLVGPMLTRWLNRDVHFRNLGGQAQQERNSGPFAGVLSGFLLGFAFAFGWTPCIGPDPRRRAGHGRDLRDRFARRFSPGLLFRWISHSFSTHGPGHQSISALLSTLPSPSPRRRSWQRGFALGRGLFDLLQSPHLAFG